MQYEIRGLAPGDNYFYIDRNSGSIFVKQPLNTGTVTNYIVCTLYCSEWLLFVMMLVEIVKECQIINFVVLPFYNSYFLL